MSSDRPSRWSRTKYSNLEVPNYIPPEALLYEKGQFVRALLLRVQANDLQRMLNTNTCEEYFVNLPLVPEYDAEGNRSNTPEVVVGQKRLDVIGEIGKMLHSYVERIDAQKSKEITHKIYFTPEQMSTGSWGAILGARGSVHQQLEKETKCKIVLVGRGITNPMKDTNANAAAMALEDPHVRITAANEHDLQIAAERVEWILSDDPEAIEFREKNRRRMAQVEGRYDPRTWVPSAEYVKATGTTSPSSTVTTDGGGSGIATKRAREEKEEIINDDELNDLIGDLI